MKTNIVKNFIVCFLSVIITVTLFVWQNQSITVSEYAYAHDLLEKELDGFKILFLSDLHSEDFDGRLLDKIKALTPDLILLGGDLVDCRHGDPQVSLQFAAACTQIADVYYAPGNHEANMGASYTDFAQDLEQVGVHVLANTGVEIRKGGGSFNLIGLLDQAFPGANAEDVITKLRQDDKCNLLLTHRPERIAEYSGADLILSGHAHGGQIRLPFVGGLIAPGQGFFPQYDAGEYIIGDAVLIVSRGLGNSIFPWRIFNRPEIVSITLSSP